MVTPEDESDEFKPNADASLKYGDCSHYMGFGDWNLCCTLSPDLCYEETPACESFERLPDSYWEPLDGGQFQCYWCHHQVSQKTNRCPRCRAYMKDEGKD